ncbi:PA0069 family radical SAM protein [Aestuariibius sp. HNIBRBA575]|uniref:PA0069 family radical SAM protein n=1 Tax=Aestuariibius sp. HNIBRBA575 TaxID=3233343 RepID=UPI0034A24E7A
MSKPAEQSRRLGRAAQSNITNRFERLRTETVEDGWFVDELPVLRTEVTQETPRKVLSYNASPDLPFDRAINPYRGCEHGCIYCFARPSHAYLGLSPGLDFETKLIARPKAAEILAGELRKPGYRVAQIAIGTNTDAYQPIEKTQTVMRDILKVLQAFNHPVAITTKGTLIERDIDILSDMARNGLVQVGVSVTSLDAQITRAMEPRVPSPARRLALIKTLSDAGIPTRVMVAPLIPALTDHELEPILCAGAENGARAATFIMLRLPREVSELFQDWLQQHFPDRAKRVMGRVRELHGGSDYDPDFGRRMTGQGIWAELIQKRFHVALKRSGLSKSLPPLRTDLFCPPLAHGGQMSLFD